MPQWESLDHAFNEDLAPAMQLLEIACQRRGVDLALLREIQLATPPRSERSLDRLDASARIVVTMVSQREHIKSSETIKAMRNCLVHFARVREYVIEVTGGNTAKFPPGVLMSTNWGGLSQALPWVE